MDVFHAHHPSLRSNSKATWYILFSILLSIFGVFIAYQSIPNSTDAIRKDNREIQENTHSWLPNGGISHYFPLGFSHPLPSTLHSGELINVLAATGKDDVYFLRTIPLVDQEDIQASKSLFSAPSHVTKNVLRSDLFTSFLPSVPSDYLLLYAYAIPILRNLPERCIDYGEQIIPQMRVKVTMHAVLIGNYDSYVDPQTESSRSPNPFPFAFIPGVSYCVVLLRCDSPPEEDVLNTVALHVEQGRGSFTQSGNPATGKSFTTALDAFPFFTSMKVTYAARRYVLGGTQKKREQIPSRTFPSPLRPEVTLGTNSVFTNMIRSCFLSQALLDDTMYNYPMYRMQFDTQKPLNLPSLELLAVYENISPDVCAALCWRQSNWGGSTRDDSRNDCRTFLLRYDQPEWDNHEAPTCELYRHPVEDLFLADVESYTLSKLFLFTIPSAYLDEKGRCTDGIIGTKVQRQWERFILEKFSGISSYTVRHAGDPLQNVKSFNEFKSAAQVGCVQGKVMSTSQLNMPHPALAQATLAPETGGPFTDRQACESTVRSISQLQPTADYSIPENQFPERVSICEKFTGILSFHCQKELNGDIAEDIADITAKKTTCNGRSFRSCYRYWSLQNTRRMDRCLSTLDYDHLNINDNEFPLRVHPHHMFAKLHPLFHSEVKWYCL